MTHQFHQEEQKRFEEEFCEDTFNDPHRLIRTDIKAFLKESNLRAMKHILEELLAEMETEILQLKEGWENYDDSYKTFLITKIGGIEICVTLITKKLSDIALEE